MVKHCCANAGFTLNAVADAHLCCGSAGTYSILSLLSNGLLHDNVARPWSPASPNANRHGEHRLPRPIGSGTAVPIRHWIELLDERIDEKLSPVIQDK